MATSTANKPKTMSGKAKVSDKTKKDNYMKTVGRSENDMAPAAKKSKAKMKSKAKC